ncbi:cell division protein FtsW [Micrococcales bacterium KH10]|nr:cell division protein FtsW [Micrococcales bacterium KH10]
MVQLESDTVRVTNRARAARAATTQRRGRFATVWDSPLTSYYMLVGATTMLLVLGLVMVLSSSSVDALAEGKSVYSKFLDQGLFVLIGLLPMLAATRIKLTFYLRFAWVLLFASFALQLLIFTPLARGKGGNMNWVAIGGSFTIQPSEFMKLALAVWLGFIMFRKNDLLHDWRHAVIPAIPVIAVALGLVMGGHDLGTAGVMILLAAGAHFVAGIPMRIFAVAAGGLGAFAVWYLAGSDNRMNRVKAWLGHADIADPQELAYQTKHGLWGLGTGGFTGVGLGAGRQKWSYLPEAHNDFIFAVIGEELGLVGTVAVLMLFAVLGIAMVRVIRRHPHPMVKVTTAAIACWIIGQALINIGVVIGLLPVIGVPLPLVSAGGSALLATMLALGIVIHFAREEPGAPELLKARPSLVRRSVAVVAHTVRNRANRPNQES